MQLNDTRYLQYAAALTAALCVVSASTYVAWCSPIVPKIAAGNSPLGNNVTTEESSWIVSSALLGTIPGSVLSGWTVEKFGRRGSMLMAGIPLVIPWLVIAFTDSIVAVCITRFLGGVAVSVAVSGALLYNGEIAEKEIRGRIGATFNIAGLTGELFAFGIGPFVSYSTFNLMCASIPLLFLVTFYFMPESPYYLSKIGQHAKARVNLKRLLRNNTTEDEVNNHMSIMKCTVDEEMKNKSSFWEFISKAEYRKSLIISFALQSIQQLTGYVAIASYMQTIIGRSKSSVSPQVSSILCGIIQLPAVFIAAAMVDRAGRKPLLIISALGCALALTTEGIYFYFQDVIKSDVSYITWVPTFGILFYIIMRPVGLGTLPFVLMGELFATNIKGHAIAVSTFYNSALGFLVAKSFEPLSKALGLHVMFFSFATVCILAALFTFFVLPETKGKTFGEIREKLNRRNGKEYQLVPLKPV